MVSRYPNYATTRIIPAYETGDSVQYESVQYWKRGGKGSVAYAKVDSCADEGDVRGRVIRNFYWTRFYDAILRCQKSFGRGVVACFGISAVVNPEIEIKRPRHFWLHRQRNQTPETKPINGQISDIRNRESRLIRIICRKRGGGIDVYSGHQLYITYPKANSAR
jgi:hypothetical protein